MQELYNAIKEHADLENIEIMDAGNHGADGGFHGFIYNGDCIVFWEKNEELILDLAIDRAEAMGFDNWLELFNTFNRKDMLIFNFGYKVLGSWFILEEVGRWLEDKNEQEEEEI